MSHSLSPSTDARIAAVYETSDSAQSAASDILEQTEVEESQLEVIAPKDFNYNEKLEGRSLPIGRNMLRQHFIWGGAGILMGGIFATLLVTFGPELTQQNPGFTFLALLSPGLFTGLFISGLLSLRPDHDPLNERVRDAARSRKWSLVIHLKNSQSKNQIMKVVKSSKPVAAI